MPLSPSMKVILDSQLPVAVKPGSKVKYPAFAYRLRTSITEGPAVPSRIGSVVRRPVRLSISVTVSVGGSLEEPADEFSWLVICLSKSQTRRTRGLSTGASPMKPKRRCALSKDRHESPCGDQAAR